MIDLEYEFLPEVNLEEIEENKNININEVIGDSSCPCCGYITTPNKGDSIAYICPVCMWEIDLFIQYDDDASDSNRGLSLKKARENYKKFGAIEKMLKKHCREAKENEEF